MESSSLPRSHLVLSLALGLSLLFTITLPASAAPLPRTVSYHNGPLLTGNVDLSIVWYGPAGRVQKQAIRNFIKSLNIPTARNNIPGVNTWWNMVESYQLVAAAARGEPVPPAPPKINVKVVRQVVDQRYSIGKVLLHDYYKDLIKEATLGANNTIVVMFAAKDVTVQDACDGRCGIHGLYNGNQPFILVGNPEVECPGVCGYPFRRSEYEPQGLLLQPPSGNVGADALVMQFASALAATVTNPYNNTGFSGGSSLTRYEASNTCFGMFGDDKTGNIKIDPKNGGAYNVQGWKGAKYLLPALWNPATSSCWLPSL